MLTVGGEAIGWILDCRAGVWIVGVIGAVAVGIGDDSLIGGSGAVGVDIGLRIAGFNGDGDGGADDADGSGAPLPPLRRHRLMYPEGGSPDGFGLTIIDSDYRAGKQRK